jgi:hypothetical protein
VFTSPQHPDQDIHKGALEGNNPDDEQQYNVHGTGLDENGMPNDPIAVAEDALGAEEDETQG